MAPRIVIPFGLARGCRNREGGKNRNCRECPARVACQTESPSRKGAALSGRRVFVAVCRGDMLVFRIPLPWRGGGSVLRLFACGECLAFSFFVALAVFRCPFPAKRNGGAVSLVFGVTKKGSSPSAQVEEANERISSAGTSILLNANNFLPRSLREAPRW